MTEPQKQEDSCWPTVNDSGMTNKPYSLASDDVPRSFVGRASAQQYTRSGRNGKGKGDPVLGVGDALGAGDSYLVDHVLPEEIAEIAFEKMREEVKWNTMKHRGKYRDNLNRMLCCVENF